MSYRSLTERKLALPCRQNVTPCTEEPDIRFRNVALFLCAGKPMSGRDLACFVDKPRWFEFRVVGGVKAQVLPPMLDSLGFQVSRTSGCESCPNCKPLVAQREQIDSSIVQLRSRVPSSSPKDFGVATSPELHLGFGRSAHGGKTRNHEKGQKPQSLPYKFRSRRTTGSSIVSSRTTRTRSTEHGTRLPRFLVSVDGFGNNGVGGNRGNVLRNLEILNIVWKPAQRSSPNFTVFTASNASSTLQGGWLALALVLGFVSTHVLLFSTTLGWQPVNHCLPSFTLVWPGDFRHQTNIFPFVSTSCSKSCPPLRLPLHFRSLLSKSLPNHPKPRHVPGTSACLLRFPHLMHLNFVLPSQCTCLSCAFCLLFPSAQSVMRLSLAAKAHLGLSNFSTCA